MLQSRQERGLQISGHPNNILIISGHRLLSVSYLLLRSMALFSAVRGQLYILHHILHEETASIIYSCTIERGGALARGTDLLAISFVSDEEHLAIAALANSPSHLVPGETATAIRRHLSLASPAHVLLYGC